MTTKDWIIVYAKHVLAKLIWAIIGMAFLGAIVYGILFICGLIENM